MAAPEAGAGPRVPVHHVGEPVPVGAVRVRTREGRARLARDQRQHGRAVERRHRVRVAARPRERGDRRRRPPVGLRPRRHGRADRDDGRRRARGRLRDPHRRRGGPRGHAGRPRDRRAAGERRGAPRAADPLERRPQAHVPSALRRGRPARALPGRDPCLPVRGNEHQDQPGRLRAAPGPRPAGGRRAAVPHRHHGAPVVHGGHGRPAGAGRPGRAGRPGAHRGVLPDGARPVARARGQAHHDDRRELPAVHAAERRAGTTSARTAPTARSRRWPSSSRSCPT